MFYQVSHYTLKSEISSEKILLSTNGIRRRFSKTPNSRGYKIKHLFKKCKCIYCLHKNEDINK